MINLGKVLGKSINAMAVIAPKTAGRIALNFFCRPIEGRKYSQKESLFLKKGNWKTLQYQRKNIQCYVWGQGKKKVLLAHGFNSNATRWRPLINLLQNSDYQVIAIDAPAHGKSDWDRVNGILYAETIEVVMEHFRPDFVIGHSFGGIALSYYFTHKKYLPVKKIIFMGVPNELLEITNVYFEKLSLNAQLKQAYFKVFEDKFGYDINYFIISQWVKKIPFPGLIIHDEQDDIASVNGAEEIYKNWKNASFLKTKNLGHSLQGRKVYKAILECLEEV